MARDIAMAVHTMLKLFVAIWFSSVAAFMVVSIPVGIMWVFRRDKNWWDIPTFLLLPLGVLWFVGALSGLAAAIFLVLEPAAHWLAHHFA
jgi:hypothetical protein